MDQIDMNLYTENNQSNAENKTQEKTQNNVENDDITTKFMYACEKNKFETIKNLVIEGVNINININTIKKFDISPLSWVCIYKNIELVKLLLQYGANINSIDNKGCTPLYYACRVNDIQIVKFLVEYKNEIERAKFVNCANNKGCTPLLNACKNKNLEMVKYLIECGANINHIDMKGCTALNYAFNDKNLEIFKYLVEHGANINYTKHEIHDTFLITACLKNNFELVKYLIEHGANVNVFHYQDQIYRNHANCKYIYYNSKYYNCINSALSIACSLGNFDMVKYLVDHGTDVNFYIGINNMPLYNACYNNNNEIIKYLVEHGANIYKYFKSPQYNDVGQMRVDIDWISYRDNNLDIFKYLIENMFKNSDFSEYDGICSYEEKKRLIDQYISERLITPSLYYKVDIIKYLLDYGADINVVYTDHKGKNITPLTNSIINYDSVKYLVENGADVNLLNPLYCACTEQYPNIYVIKILVENGADVKCFNPLNYICKAWKTDFEIVKYFVEKGVKIDMHIYELLCTSLCYKDLIYILNYLLFNNSNNSNNSNNDIKLTDIIDITTVNIYKNSQLTPTERENIINEILRKITRDIQIL